MMPRTEVSALLSSATVFVCPSVYEPFGIVNVEAMACGRPVVASRVGGIPEVVVHEETGFLVPYTPDPKGDPEDPAAFARALAERVNQLARDPDLAVSMGKAGRARAIERFSWKSIAKETLELYQRLVAKPVTGE
jgi:starch synthase